MGYIRLRRRQFGSAGANEASEARPRFGSLGLEFRLSKSAVAAALYRRTPKVSRAASPADSSSMSQGVGRGSTFGHGKGAPGPRDAEVGARQDENVLLRTGAT